VLLNFQYILDFANKKFLWLFFHFELNVTMTLENWRMKKESHMITLKFFLLKRKKFQKKENDNTLRITTFLKEQKVKVMSQILNISL
jgi:hypothetical protein